MEKYPLRPDLSTSLSILNQLKKFQTHFLGIGNQMIGKILWIVTTNELEHIKQCVLTSANFNYSSKCAIFPEGSGIGLQNKGYWNCTRAYRVLGELNTQRSVGISTQYPVPLRMCDIIMILNTLL
jgi:hypothetical protein